MKLEELVKEHWDGPSTTAVQFKIIQEKSPLFAILRIIGETNPDLVIIGRMAFGSDMAVHLARKAPCSVMCVPCDAKVDLKKILVPTDFSDYSQMALEMASAFCKSAQLTSIDSVNIFSLGRLSHRVSIPEEEQIAIAEGASKEQHAEFLEKMPQDGITIHPLSLRDESTWRGVVKACHELETDLIVTSCRGKNAMTSWLLGSNTEELLRTAPVPVVAVKPKGTGQSFLSALLQV